MEKLSPSCPLSIVRRLIAEGKVRASISASTGAAALGFEYNEMIAIVVALAPRDFYKSMTTHVDHRVWQDVYRPVTKAGALYLKLTVVDDVLIVSFKEL